MIRTARRLTGVVTGWPVRTQQVARRNAMVAGTALAERRREREEVEAFLAQHHAARGSATQRLRAGVRPA
jgi:hypothetical protein